MKAFPYFRRTSRSAAALLLFVVTLIVIAAAPARAEGDTGLLIDLGNTKCPVMGGQVDGVTYTEWSGLRIGHCCGGCSKALLSNPEKYLDKTGVKWRKALKAVEKVNAATGAERDKLLAALERSYEVVRSPAPVLPKRYVATLGNEKCPIMGGPVDGRTFTIWNGLKIGHCCPGCTAKFLENPGKRLSKANVKWQDAAKAVAALNAASTSAQPKQLKALQTRYTLSEIEPGLLIDLGNAKCPVMRGRGVNGRTFTTWNGLRVGHCCPGCSRKLLANPEKVLDAGGIDWRGAADAVAQVDNATGEKQQKLIQAAKRKYKVLSAPGDE